jgi:hypothetical protein
MANVVKFIGTQETMNTSPTSVGNSTLVRINNTNSGANHTITHKSNGDITIATFTLLFAGGDESFVYLKKDPTDTIQTDDDSTDVVAVRCAFF